MENKDKKGYSNNRTALFIDVTNIVFIAELLGITEMDKRIFNYINQNKAKVKFGAIVTFITKIDQPSLQVMHWYSRIDNWDISIGLRYFLDKHFVNNLSAQNPNSLLASEVL